MGSLIITWSEAQPIGQRTPCNPRWARQWLSPGCVPWGTATESDDVTTWTEIVYREGARVVVLTTQNYMWAKSWGNRISRRAKGVIQQSVAWTADTEKAALHRRERRFTHRKKEMISAFLFYPAAFPGLVKTYLIIFLSNMSIFVFLT